MGGRVLDEDGRPLPRTLVEVWQANAAGRYLHAVDQHDAPLDPNFTRRRPHADRRRGPLPLRHDPARRLSVAQPPQRLAARAHPLLGLRPGLRHAARHADVLPRRSAARRRPDLQLHRRRDGARGRLVSEFDWETHRARARARLPLRHGAARARRDAHGGRARARRHARRRPSGRSTRSGSTGWRATSWRRRRRGRARRRARAHPRRRRRAACPTRCSSSGRRTPPAATPTPRTRRRSRSIPRSGASAASPTDATGALPLHDRQAGTRARARAAGRRPRTSWSPSSREGSMKRLVTRMYFPDEPANASDLALGLRRAARRVDAGRRDAPARRVARVERRAAGAGRDRILRLLRCL